MGADHTVIVTTFEPTLRPATIDEVPIGNVTGNGNGLVHLSVDPGRQAGGLGRRLLDAGEELLAAHGHRDVELSTMVGNEPAIGPYLSAGWTMTDQVEHSEHDGPPTTNTSSSSTCRHGGCPVLTVTRVGCVRPR